MLSGTVLSEATSITLSYLFIAVPLMMASLGCSERRDVIPEEPRVSTSHDGRGSLPALPVRIQAGSSATWANHSSASHQDLQDRARAWLVERHRRSDAASASPPHHAYDQAQNRSNGFYGDYQVIEESDAFQRRLYPTLKF